MENNQPDGLSEEQQGKLAEWLADRDARMAARSRAQPAEETLNDRLRTMDETFQNKSTENDPRDAQIHELSRTVLIYEEVIRQLLGD
ncbi:hypothetical protein [Streptomyces sp. NEAU-174]|uniref:hypothetical protein n=1 Tax=Streptomyces sp. NEAU-174 TaxID=3458254 RepID=UPI004044E405